MSKHEDVYRDLRKKILNGSYATRSALESEEVLSKRYGVSRPTLHKALDALKRDGLVHSRQGAGIFVNPSEFFIQNNLTTLSERYAGEGVVITSEVLLLETVPSRDMGEMFQIDPSDPLIHYLRLRRVDGHPKSLEETYMPSYLFPSFEEECLQGSMIHYIEDVCGYSISHVNKRIKPVIAEGETASRLEVPEGTAMLQVNHSVYLLRSVMVQYTVETTLDSSISVTSVR
ncbi:GntR family transcriptional regulator [Thermophilibacter immobilis]|uniref:GntR family transcriptional regulator n=1 Tax=Thermophilibacter immobilis TaxID=2779519 RepID=A0A7S7M8V1_9ACTN|nr:GntR family transcriptional regulator [Thermophilibacter immobilis]QOY60879.1 GntR family transcriptional regulator [Thermophilibacter immobilis]